MWEAPSSDPILPLGPQPGLGGQPLVHKRRFVAPIIRSPGRAAGQLDLQCRNLLSISGPSWPLCRARPRPPAQRGQEPGDGEEEGGQRRARQEAQWPLPGLFLCCSCVTTEKSREVPQPSCLSPFEIKGTKWRRAAASRPGLRLQFPIPPARSPPVSSVRQH